MNTLKLEMENCYGIQKMQQDIDFSKNNVAVIYAPNGTMKSSFAKTFEAIRDGKTVEEKVYGCKSKYSITDETATAISPESIMVINPFDENAYENQGTLMANEKLRRQYIQIYKSIDQSRDAMFGKIKASLKYSSRSSFDAESSMLSDWGYTKKDLFLCLKDIETKLNDSELQCALKEEELDYNTLFNSKVYSMVTSGKTSELIEEYEKKIEFAAQHTEMHKFDFTGLAELTAQLCESKVPVYLTIDLDCLDPSCFPGTGTPEAGGVSFLQLLDAIRTVTKANIIGADLNELAPTLDTTGVSTATACKILRETLIALDKGWPGFQV